jgi:large subunit ribosomal protein L5
LAENKKNSSDNKKVEPKINAEKKKEVKLTVKPAQPNVSPTKMTVLENKKTSEVNQKKVSVEETNSKISKPPQKEWSRNPMLEPLIEKVTVNMSVGKSGVPLQQAVTIIEQLTNQTPSKRKAKRTIREFGIRKGESIACLVTLRGENAIDFLKKAFSGVDNKLSKHCFDRQGNFSFGIKEHINIPGTKYLPELGIHGMDISVSLGRPGYRVKRRHRARTKIGKEHLLTTEEAILFIKDQFDVEIM